MEEMKYKVDRVTLVKKLHEVVGWARGSLVPVEDANYEISLEAMDAARNLEVQAGGWHRAMLALVMGCIAEQCEIVQDKAAEDRECEDMIAEGQVDDQPDEMDWGDDDDEDDEHWL